MSSSSLGTLEVGSLRPPQVWIALESVVSLSAFPARVATDMARTAFLGMRVSVDYIWRGFLGRLPPATPTHLASGAD